MQSIFFIKILFDQRAAETIYVLYSLYKLNITVVVVGQAVGSISSKTLAYDCWTLAYDCYTMMTACNYTFY